MQSSFYHLQCNIDYTNINFYKNLFEALGWSVIFENPEVVIGFTSGKNGDIWFAQSENSAKQNYDDTGINHISIRVTEQKDVDTIVSLIKDLDAQPLFDTPRHRSEFADGPEHTYYQVMFESRDGILFEIVYIGLKELL